MSTTLTKRASFSGPKMYRNPKSKNNQVLKGQKKLNLKYMLLPVCPEQFWKMFLMTL